MAIAMRDCNPNSISAEEVITGDVYSVAPEDDIKKALELMQEHQVRRVPVVNPEGDLEGLLSLNDIVLKAEGKKNGKAPEVGYADVVNTYKAICAHRVPVQAQVQAQAATGNQPAPA
jgi:CBS domain-containing protein